jgi:hypothetical protein
MVAEARQNSVAIVRKGEAAIANDCTNAGSKPTIQPLSAMVEEHQ